MHPCDQKSANVGVVVDSKKKGGKPAPPDPPPRPRGATPGGAPKPARPAPLAERVRPGAIRDRDEPTSPATDLATAAVEASKKRRHVRVAERPALSLRMRYHVIPSVAGAPFALDSTQARAGQAEDLTTGGVFVLAEQLPAVGTRLAVELDLASTWQPLIIVGEVRWHREDPRGFGVAFVDLTAAAHVALGQLLTTLKFGE